MKKTDKVIFSLGFKINQSVLLKGTEIIEIESGSQAEKSGLKKGDVLQGFGLYEGDPSEKAEFKIIRNQQRDLKYLAKHGHLQLYWIDSIFFLNMVLLILPIRFCDSISIS